MKHRAADPTIRASLQCPLGWLVVEGTTEAVSGIDFAAVAPVAVGVPAGAVASALAQLVEYIEGCRVEFDFATQPAGTPFQQAVWRELLKVDFGKTLTYMDIALAVGNPKGVRAVGQAIGRNPISIVVPCHRIIGSNGKMTGYAGELWRKEWLLAHEQHHYAASSSAV